jgi:hypothetical protein
MVTKTSTSLRRRFIAVRKMYFEERIAGLSNELLAVATMRDIRRWYGEAHMKALDWYARRY